jgi:hypothetical protein
MYGGASMLNAPQTGRAGAESMPTEYYIWKWADNDLDGQPAKIVEQLGTGEIPLSLELFLVRKVYSRLYQVLTQCRSELSEIIVDPQFTGSGSARFIRFRHPLGSSQWLADKLLWAVWDAELTVCDATTNRLIGLPKRNVVEHLGGRQFVDIKIADLPGLLHELSAQPGLSALTCYDRDGNMFQVWAHQRRYAVEWQVLPGRNLRLHRIWVAGRIASNQRQARLGTLECGLNLLAPEILGVADVYRLWVAFLAGARPPVSHKWRDVTKQLNLPGQPLRYRHQGPKQRSLQTLIGGLS